MVYGCDFEDDWGFRRRYWKSVGVCVYVGRVCAGKVAREEVFEMREVSLGGEGKGTLIALINVMRLMRRDRY